MVEILGVNLRITQISVCDAKLFKKLKKKSDKNDDVIFDDSNDNTMEDWHVGCVKGIDNDLNLMFVTQAPKDKKSI